MRAWVVEIGKPSRVASNTVSPAASATAAGKTGSADDLRRNESLARERPQQLAGQDSAVTEPSAVVSVAHRSARR